MSYNPNFYNNFTFHGDLVPLHNFSIPPPPAPPRFYIQTQQPGIADEEFVKTFERKINTNLNNKKTTTTTIPLSKVKEHLKSIVQLRNILKEKESTLKEKFTDMGEEEWKNKIEEIKTNKANLDHLMAQINDSYLKHVQKSLAKRAAKRLRLKRIRIERKQMKQDTCKEWEERSRKIDENLQKIKDDILKAKQDEESKAQADIVLKEVLRKKHDAKKCIAKLDALIKLRRARQNTAKGRGASVTENAAMDFNSSIERLKSIWTKQLAAYNKEETDLRSKLKRDTDKLSLPLDGGSRDQIVKDLAKWRECLFGDEDATPQVDFQGDLDHFVAVRCKWDQYISVDGSSMPIGWVTPALS